MLHLKRLVCVWAEAIAIDCLPTANVFFIRYDVFQQFLR